MTAHWMPAVPPWDYEPEAPFRFAAYYATPPCEVISLGEAHELSGVIGDVLRFFCPPREDQGIFVIDRNHRVVVGWETEPGRPTRYFGTERGFDVLADMAKDPLTILGWRAQAHGDLDDLMEQT